METIKTLPGELGPLTLRTGGQPVSDDEALGVLRRHVRQRNESCGTSDPLPTELPLPNGPGKTPATSFRVKERTLIRARARAEMEGRGISAVVNELLHAYADAEPGSAVTFVRPQNRNRR